VAVKIEASPAKGQHHYCVWQRNSSSSSNWNYNPLKQLFYSNAK